MARIKVQTTARIPNLDTLRRLVNFMAENGYLAGGTREGYIEYVIEDAQREGEHWFSNGHSEFKIITTTGPYGGIRLHNFRLLTGPKMDALFAVVAE